MHYFINGVGSPESAPLLFAENKFWQIKFWHFRAKSGRECFCYFLFLINGSFKTLYWNLRTAYWQQDFLNISKKSKRCGKTDAENFTSLRSSSLLGTLFNVFFFKLILSSFTCAFLPILPFIFHLSQSQKLDTEQAVSPDAGVFQVICTRTYSLACYAVRQLKLSGKNTKLKTMPAVFLFVSAFSFSSLLATVRLIPSGEPRWRWE